jgi:hemin uptake protein HemP
MLSSDAMDALLLEEQGPFAMLSGRTTLSRRDARLGGCAERKTLLQAFRARLEHATLVDVLLRDSRGGRQAKDVQKRHKRTSADWRRFASVDLLRGRNGVGISDNSTIVEPTQQKNPAPSTPRARHHRRSGD